MTAPVTHVQDEAAVAKLVVVFASAADDGATVDEVTKLFTADGVFEVFGDAHTGREAIGRYLQGNRDAGFAGPDAGTRHLITNVVVDIDGENGTGSSEWLLLARSSAPADPPTLVASGRYLDRYRRVDGRWFLAHRAIG